MPELLLFLRATNLCLRGSRVKWRSGHGMDDGAGTDVVLLFSKSVYFNVTIFF